MLERQLPKLHALVANTLFAIDPQFPIGACNVPKFAAPKPRFLRTIST
jgi:hypothetical protein